MRPLYFALAVGTVLTAAVYPCLPTCLKTRVERLAARGVILLRAEST